MNLAERVKGAFQVLVKGANPIISSASMPWDTQGKIRPGDYNEMVKHYYSWVYVAISCNASNIAKTPLHLYVKKKDKGKPRYEEISEHPF